MALRKNIRQDDGVTTDYHRILYIQITPGQQNSIAVVSYVDNEARTTESSEVMPYRRAVTYEVEYDENMTVTTAYKRLKKLPEFADAADV